jgi:hypothetical protein
MKNHLGTFINSGSDTGAGDASATGLHSIDAICNINKHPAVLGGNPVRQQLCIIDGLLANGNSAGGSFDTRVDRLIMGTFAPIVDYLTAMRIMKDVMNKPDANNNLPKFLTNFDYAETDALDWNEYVPGSGTVAPPTGGSGGSAGGGSAGSGGSPAGGTSSAGGGRGGGAGGGRGGNPSSAGGGRGGSASGAGGTTGSNTGAGGTASGGATAGAGTTENGGTAAGSSATGGAGGTPTSTTSASGGSTMTGGASAGAATTAHAAGGSGAGSEATQTTGAQHAAAKSAGGCSVAGVDRRATPWGAMLAFGAAVAGKFWRRVNGNDRSS